MVSFSARLAPPLIVTLGRLPPPREEATAETRKFRKLCHRDALVSSPVFCL
jgi:hypothetical protein